MQIRHRKTLSLTVVCTLLVAETGCTAMGGSHPGDNPFKGKPADDRCAVERLKAGADSSIKHESGAMPIHLAAASNYINALRELLERRPQDVNAQTNIGITPLMMAATEGRAEAANLLLKFGADRALTDSDGLTAKQVAIKNGNAERVPLLS